MRISEKRELVNGETRTRDFRLSGKYVDVNIFVACQGDSKIMENYQVKTNATERAGMCGTNKDHLIAYLQDLKCLMVAEIEDAIKAVETVGKD